MLTKFETQAVAPSSMQTWYHTLWTLEQTKLTHQEYKLSSMPMKVDDGDAKILRVEMEEGIGNSKGVLEDKVMEEIVLPLPTIEDETRHDISNMLIVRKCLENLVLQS